MYCSQFGNICDSNFRPGIEPRQGRASHAYPTVPRARRSARRGVAPVPWRSASHYSQVFGLQLLETMCQTRRDMLPISGQNFAVSRNEGHF